MYSIFKQPTALMKKHLRKSADMFHDMAGAYQSAQWMAKALELPLQQGVLNGDTLGDIYEVIPFERDAKVEFPLDFLAPGDESGFIGYTIPNTGLIPYKNVEGDLVTVPTYKVGASIDWPLHYSESARWDVLSRAFQVLEGMFVRKLSFDGWHTLLATGNSRNIVTYDNAATAGLFTKRVVSLGKVVMRRNAGGNTASLRRGKMTHMYVSPEATEDVRSWDLTQIDDFTRREIFIDQGESLRIQIAGVNIVEMDELGVGQAYQSYFTGTLGGSMPSDKVEICVGLDLQNRDSFVMPVRKNVELFADPMLHRHQKAGWYGWCEIGFSNLDSRRVLLLAI